jgi:hypothetical protein
MNGHRMAWLVERAGIRYTVRKPKRSLRDACLLVLSGIALLVITYGSAFLAYFCGIRTESVLIGIAGSVFVAVCVALHFLLNRSEKALWHDRIGELTEMIGDFETRF